MAVEDTEVDAALEALREEFESDLEVGKVEPFRVERGLSILALVGDAMHHHTGLSGRAFDALSALRKEDVDGVISSDPEEGEAVFAPLFDYSPVFISAASHPLAAKPFIEAEDFEDQTLLSYPVDRSRLDSYKLLLHPAGVTRRNGTCALMRPPSPTNRSLKTNGEGLRAEALRPKAETTCIQLTPELLLLELAHRLYKGRHRLFRKQQTCGVQGA